MNRRSFIKSIAVATTTPLAILKAKPAAPFPPPASTNTNVESTELTIEMLMETKRMLDEEAEKYPFGRWYDPVKGWNPAMVQAANKKIDNRIFQGFI